ncbi:MAG: FG-GAP-like repeat-containing protein [Candidatus Poribacteria bacterium]
MSVESAVRLNTHDVVSFIFYGAILLVLSLGAYAKGPQRQFIDVTAEAGIRFRHVNGAAGNFHSPETIGAGGAFLDYDNDGNLDLYLVNSGNWPGSTSDETATSLLYRNNGDGTFTDATVAAGVSNAGNYGQGATVGDYDNDGDSDLYVTNFGSNVLYRNNGDGTFTDVTDDAGVGDGRWSSSCTFFDYNRDGYLDLYVVNYVRYSIDISYRPCGTPQARTYCSPSVFEGVLNRLYRNNGDGTFTDVTEAAGVGGGTGFYHGKGLGVVAADFNNDGRLDLYIANDDTPNTLFYNKGDGTFIDIGLIAGCAYSFDGIAQAGMGVDAGDYNGDGLLDIFVTNLSQETNALYRNNGDATFTDVIHETNLGKASYLFLGFGTGFFDYDNDGHLDIFVANGHVSNNIEQISDVITHAQPNQLFRNNGDGTFTDVSSESGAHFQLREVSRGTIFGDYDNDGDVDVVVCQSNGPAVLLRNEGRNRRNWLRVKTVGVISNRDGIGARVTVKMGERLLAREVHTGSSYLCGNDPRLNFGVDEHTRIVRLEIRWPSGVVQTLENLSVNHELIAIELPQASDKDLLRRHPTDVVSDTGTNVDAKDVRGQTALMVAALNGRVKAVELLIENGADVNATNAKGQTALTLAASKGHTAIVRLLKNAGAKE